MQQRALVNNYRAKFSFVNRSTMLGVGKYSIHVSTGPDSESRIYPAASEGDEPGGKETPLCDITADKGCVYLLSIG